MARARPLRQPGFGQLLQGSPPAGVPRPSVRARVRRRRRPVEPAGAARRPQPGAACPDARPRRRPPARRVERDLWYFGEGTRFVPADPTSGRRCSSGCSSSSTTTSRRSRSSASGSPSRAGPRRSPTGSTSAWRRVPRARRDGGAPRGGREYLVGDAPRSRTSRSTRIRTSRRRAGSTSRYPAIRGWIDRVAATPGHFRSTPERRDRGGVWSWRRG